MITPAKVRFAAMALSTLLGVAVGREAFSQQEQKQPKLEELPTFPLAVTCTHGRLVIAETSRSLPNAWVSLRFGKIVYPTRGESVARLMPGKLVRKARTDGNGAFSLHGLAVGPYVLEVKIGNEKATGWFQFSGGIESEHCEQTFSIQKIEGALVVTIDGKRNIAAH